MPALLAAMALLPAFQTARAAVSLPALFSNNMVLQHGVPVKVWGWADSGETVTVAMQGQTNSVVAAGGRWMVTLTPLSPGGPFTMTVQGQNALTISNILVGEVWIACGQSNMMMALGSDDNAAATISESTNYPLVRLFNVGGDAWATSIPHDISGSWAQATPATVGGYSAVSYYFARAITRDRGIPVGMINTIAIVPAEAWVDPDTLHADPELDALFSDSLHVASKSYMGMLAPLQPYTIKGAIYYQGEYNGGRGAQFRTLFPALIKSWRTTWGQGDFPFCFVQLPGYFDGRVAGDTRPIPVIPPGYPSGWSELREAQLMTWQTVTNTGMAVGIDVGDAWDIHPTNKRPIGERLAKAARAVAYGESLVHSGPILDSVTQQGSNLVLCFTHTGSGLAPTGRVLEAFAVAGPDQDYVWASAVIDNPTSVVVSAAGVTNPIHVRYAWSMYPWAFHPYGTKPTPPTNALFNVEGLPASPFRAHLEGRAFQVDTLSIPFMNPSFEDQESGSGSTNAAAWGETGAVRTNNLASDGSWSMNVSLPLYNGVRQDGMVVSAIHRYDWNSDLLDQYRFRPGTVTGYSVDMASGDGLLGGLYMNLCSDSSAGGYQYWGGIPVLSTTNRAFVRRHLAMTMVPNFNVSGSWQSIGGRFLLDSSSSASHVYVDRFSNLLAVRPSLGVSDDSAFSFGVLSPNMAATSAVRTIINAQQVTLPDVRSDANSTSQVATVLYGVGNITTMMSWGFKHAFSDTDHVGARIIGTHSNRFEFISSNLGANSRELKLIGADGQPGLKGGLAPESETLRVRFTGAPQVGVYTAVVRIVTQAGNRGSLSRGAAGEPLENLYYVDMPVSAEVSGEGLPEVPAVDNAFGATNVTSTNAWLTGTLTATGSTPPVVWVFWDTNNWTTNKSWAFGYNFGGLTQTNSSFTYRATNLAPNKGYWYTYYASNAAGQDAWPEAGPVFFTTPALPFDNTPASTSYVARTGGSAPYDGTSWAHPFTNVQEAINAVSPGSMICLKGETFPLPVNSSLGRLVWQKSNLSILGGFAADGGTPGGLTNTPTVLTVDAASGHFETNRILYVSNVTNGVLANVTISGGRAAYSSTRDVPTYRNGYGAGLFVQNSTNLTVANVIFDGNTIATRRASQSFGAGAYATASWGTFTNCLFRNNSIGNNYPDATMYLSGAGLALSGGGWSLRECVIRDNLIVDQWQYANIGRGLGLYIDGGVHGVSNCLITHNVRTDTSSVQGDGIYVANGTGTFVNCTLFWHGTEGVRGAAGTVTLKDSIVWDCGDDISGTGVSLQYCDIQDGDSNGVAGCFSADPLFERGLYLAPNSPCANTGSQTASAAGMGGRTTRSDGLADSGQVDLGYHFASGVQDYYVSINSGSDANAGTSPGVGNAFKTIGKALSMAGDGACINIEAGTYSTNSETFPLQLVNRYGVQLRGTNAAVTVINAKGANRQALKLSFAYPAVYVGELTITGVSRLYSSGITGGIGDGGGGICLSHVYGTVASCLITNNALPNSSGWGAVAGAGVFASQSVLVMTNCLVKGNSTDAWYPENCYAAGIFSDTVGTFVNCTIVSNTSSVGGTSYGDGQHAYGGGLYVNGNTTIRNCLIAGNDAKSTATTGKTPHGDAAYVAGGTVEFQNCTVVSNHPSPHARGADSYTGGLGIERGGGTVNIINSILWGNGDDLVGTIASLRHSDIEDGDIGTNCIAADPQFVSLPVYNLRLRKTSPCINTGTNLAWTVGAIDLDGNPRVQNKKVDMGAYEITMPPSGSLMIVK